MALQCLTLFSQEYQAKLAKLRGELREFGKDLAAKDEAKTKKIKDLESSVAFVKTQLHNKGVLETCLRGKLEVAEREVETLKEKMKSMADEHKDDKKKQKKVCWRLTRSVQSQSC